MKPDQPLLPAKEKIEKFRTFCAESWKASMELVHAAQKKQSERHHGDSVIPAGTYS